MRSSMAVQRSRSRGRLASRCRCRRMISSTFSSANVERHFVDRTPRRCAVITASGSTSQKSAILSFMSVGQETLGAAQQDIRLDTDGAQFLHAVLRGFGLQFLRGVDPRHQRHVHEDAVLAPHFMTHLADGFEKRQRFDIAHRAADFADHHIHFARELLHRRLDFVGDVRNHLHGLAEIIAAPLALDDLFVDAPAGQVVGARERGVGEALVVAEIEIGLGAIVGDENFAVLERAHGARDRR